MSIENETAEAETLIDPTSDSFGADDTQSATSAEDADASGAEEWGEDKPEGDDEDQDDDAEGDDEEETGEKLESHKVPISRLKKEIEKKQRFRDERDAIAAERDALRAERDALRSGTQTPAPTNDPLAELRKADPEIAQIEAWIAQHDPEKIDPDNFQTNTEYQRAVAAALVRQNQGQIALQAKETNFQIAKHNQASQAQAAEVAYFEKLGTRYNATIEASKIPGAATYAKNVANRANQLAPEIQRAILEHPEPDVIAAALGSSRKTFDEFVAASKKGVTHSTMMRLGEVVASYKAGMSRGGDEPAPTPRKPVEPVRRRPTGGDPTRTDDRGGILSVGREPLSQMKKELGLY